MKTEEPKGFKCGANRTADPPQDCDWPFCGCDDHATKVLEAVLECGWLAVIPGLSIDYNRETDVLTIAGVKYTAGLFRDLGGLQPDRWIKIVKREDGVLTVTQAPPGARVAWEGSHG